MIDFTNCPVDVTANYGGSDQKRGIIYQQARYMLKMADRINDRKRNSMNSTYSNSIYSEKVCCDILATLGFDVQETLLGYIMDKKGNQKLVVACKNFVPHGYSLVDFRAIEDAVLDSKAGKTPRLKDIYTIFRGNNAYFTKELGQIALQRYWEMFLLDALFGNFDRYANNWAYLIGRDGFKFAPIYDCGSCLYPQISDEAIPTILNSYNAIKERVYKFPTAALLLDNGKKANYYDYIFAMSDKDLMSALIRIVPRLDMHVINKVIQDNTDLTPIRKKFYITMIEHRLNWILVPAYKKACTLVRIIQSD